MSLACHAHEIAPPAELPAESLATLPGAIVVELEAAEHGWEIAPGRSVAGYAFNGQVPGPVIHARQGVPLEVRFTNRPPEPTLIHWHGLRVPATMDGTQEVQRPVQPGETFIYRFTPPDAGTLSPPLPEARAAAPRRRGSPLARPSGSGTTRTPTRPSSSRRAFTAR